jgi:Carbohydrate family 9 binding domain-like
MFDEKQLITAHHLAADIGVADLQSAEWNSAQAVQIDRYWSGAPAPAGRAAEARILWSSKALHIRFVCHQAEPLIVSATPQTEKKTMGLWDRDVCEIFIAPDSNLVERYLEFEAAPNGEWLDVAIHWTPEKRESDWEFHSHMTTAARIEKDRVTIAMRIPWNHWIHEPQRGERWRVNLFRCVGSDPGRGYLAWQPTRTPQPSFHVPQVFGWLVFK